MSRYVDTDAFDDTVQQLNEKGWYITNIDYKRMDRVLFEMPTADVVEVKRGYWKGKPIAGNCTVRCSVCGSAFLENDGRWNYCPNCGADMRGEQNEC